ncbi:hypothetical protein FQN60_014613 [Etheostoma spectabile]|uniref:Uncharacterized protein n=1 Tax=Etheostoma spectabile TaxID=54343 RepID=A0A5J5D7F1_9PERO|nr:hypothetical protein FQN60_014606 [Etheostoma spectabile]KAA8590679.1 hypothetical protein FQN60_014613 [Etheostoma spectabile]
MHSHIYLYSLGWAWRRTSCLSTIFYSLMRDFPSGQSAAFPGWDFWRSRVCTRRRGEFCQWSFQRCTERAGGRCSTPTPTWWICIRWGPTTTAWGPRCCTLTAQRTPRSHRRCCRRSSVASDGTWTPPRMPTTRTRLRWWSVWTAWRRLCSRRGRAASTASRAGRRAGPPSSPPPVWFSTTARGRSPIYSPDLELKDTETGHNLWQYFSAALTCTFIFISKTLQGFPQKSCLACCVFSV